MFPFHLSLFVEDLDRTKDFYIKCLGGKLGREPEGWLDIILFEHQFTFHQAKPGQKVIPVDHFGIVLDRETWSDLLNQVHSYSVGFVSQPTLYNEDTEDEFGKFLILDPDCNILEFKYYQSFCRTVKATI